MLGDLLVDSPTTTGTGAYNLMIGAMERIIREDSAFRAKVEQLGGLVDNGPGG